MLYKHCPVHRYGKYSLQFSVVYSMYHSSLSLAFCYFPHFYFIGATCSNNPPRNNTHSILHLDSSQIHILPLIITRMIIIMDAFFCYSIHTHHIHKKDIGIFCVFIKIRIILGHYGINKILRICQACNHLQFI